MTNDITAAAEFKNNGLAPMRRGEDGTVQLDLGRLGSVSERLVVTYERDGKVIGRSPIAPQPGRDAPLEARVLEARNSLFAQELWYELGREARILAAYNVRPQGSSLNYAIDDNTNMLVELVSLDSAPLPDDSLPYNSIAEALALTLHLLLSYSHRLNEYMRTRPIPPYVPRSRGQQAYTLLRPIIGRIACLHSIADSIRYVGGLVKSLSSAGLPASVILHTTRPTIPDSMPQMSNQQSTATQRFMRNVVQPPVYSLEVTLAPGITLTIFGRTFLSHFIATYYHVQLPASSPLEKVCPPHKDGYTDIASLADYLRTAVSRVLTHYFISKLPGDSWYTSISGSSIRHKEHDRWELRFALQDAEKCVDVGINKANVSPVLLVGAVSNDDEGKTSSETYTYKADGSANPELGPLVERLTAAVTSA